MTALADELESIEARHNQLLLDLRQGGGEMKTVNSRQPLSRVLPQASAASPSHTNNRSASSPVLSLPSRLGSADFRRSYTAMQRSMRNASARAARASEADRPGAGKADLHSRNELPRGQSLAPKLREAERLLAAFRPAKESGQTRASAVRSVPRSNRSRRKTAAAVGIPQSRIGTK